MNETWFSVSHEGQFLFRTQPDDIHSRVEAVRDDLCVKFPKSEGYRVTENVRPKAYTSREIND